MQDAVIIMSTIRRGVWAGLTDEQLLAQCEVDTYRASGPGGQKRNKTSSAVRIRHPGSGLIVIAEESRSQHENKAKALKRLRHAFYLKVREETPAAGWMAHADFRAARDDAGRLHMGKKDPRFWPAAGVVLDVLRAYEARVSEAAEALGVGTANLVGFLAVESKVWEEANHLRARFGHKPLRND